MYISGDRTPHFVPNRESDRYAMLHSGKTAALPFGECDHRFGMTGMPGSEPEATDAET